MNRLSDLTNELRAAPGDRGFNQLTFLTLKHHDSPDSAQPARQRLSPHAGIDACLKAAVAFGSLNSVGWGRELAQYQSLAAGWVTTNEAETFLSHLPYRRVGFDTPVGIETTPPKSTWIGNGAQIPMSRPTLAASAKLGEKQIACMVGFSEELSRSWTPTTELELRAAMKRANNLGLDTATLDPTIAATDNGPASLLYGLTPLTFTGVTAAQVEADMKTLFSSATELKRCLGAMSASVALFFTTLKDANGARVFPEMSAIGGTIWGVRFITTAACETAAGSVIALVDGSKILVADDGLVLLAASNAAAVQMSDGPGAGATALVSAFQTHTTLLRMLRVLNFVRATDDAANYFVASY